jgi:ribosome maturation factor RimP
MENRQKIVNKLVEIVEPVCADAGYELVDVQYTLGPQGWVVRVFIDYPEGNDTSSSGGGISFSDCERVSRELSAVLDVEDPIPQAYTLEVSSPGVARPLRTAEHFRRYIGQDARVTLSQGVDGRRKFHGTLVAVQPGQQPNEFIVAMEVDGKTYQLPVADVASANLVPNWDALIGKSSGKSARKQR